MEAAEQRRSALEGIPHELLHSIFSQVRPEDIAALARTSRSLYTFLKKNSLLFKDIYTMYLDEPSESVKPDGWDWEEEVHKYVKLKRYLSEAGAPSTFTETRQKSVKLDFVANAITNICRTANPNYALSLSTKFLADAIPGSSTQGVSNKEAFLCRSITYIRAARHNKIPETTFAQRQLSAKLHCYHGVPSEVEPLGFKRVYPYAVSMVYDLRNYNDFTMWGPFLDDGKASVDWEKMEAVMLVLGHNLKLFQLHTSQHFDTIWETPWWGTMPGSFQQKVKPGIPPVMPSHPEDPYNISGTWMRVVCFLDFRELFAYNFEDDTPLPASQPRHPLSTTEAIRLLVMELEFDRIEGPGEDDRQDMPVVWFKGISRSVHTPHDPNANANIRGCVKVTHEGEVRWTSWSIYSGQERWKSEGIQVGGIGSGRGVLGHWFDKDLDEQGPAGPTAFWKTSNKIGDAPGSGGHNHDNSDDSDDLDDEISQGDGDGDNAEAPNYPQSDDQGDTPPHTTIVWILT
ncbi:hypothetical protein BGZ60DRAFT_532799 [Tricladium varicosporioides]|nr:hypothetical protein BGZ60DRAFT_532799 [Hymenoscyphus varicosporioides]